MKKNLIVAVLLFLGIAQSANAQFGLANSKIVYTVDQEIPSYIIPSIKDLKDSIPTKRGRNMLEQLLSLNNNTTAVLVDTLTDSAGGFHEFTASIIMA